MDGRALAQQIETSLTARVQTLITQGIQPRLVILVVGHDERTASYIRAKQRSADRVGITVQIVPFQAKTESTTLQEQLKATITDLNQNPSVHGIILQLPVPRGIDTNTTLNAISPTKDVDGLTATNRAAVELGRELFPPATPMGIIRLLEANSVPIAHTTVAVIGQGKLVGQPLACMLKHRGAIVRRANSETTDLSSITHGAQIVVSATGRPNLITPDLIDPGTVLIDAGLSEVGQTLVGDVTPEAATKARLVTPVPGGVGPMTVVSLLGNVVVAAELSVLERK